MSTTTSDWRIIYPDGSYVSNEELGWGEISVARQYGSETLYVLDEPAISLSARCGTKWHTLRAPAGEEVHFFRHYRARTSLVTGQSDRLYHAIGYVFSLGKVTLEIDDRGSTNLRLDLIENAR